MEKHSLRDTTPTHTTPTALWKIDSQSNQNYGVFIIILDLLYSILLLDKATWFSSILIHDLFRINYIIDVCGTHISNWTKKAQFFPTEFISFISQET